MLVTYWQRFNPFIAHFTFTSVEGGTEATWAAGGNMNYPKVNIFSMFADKTMEICIF